MRNRHRTRKLKADEVLSLTKDSSFADVTYNFRSSKQLLKTWGWMNSSRGTSFGRNFQYKSSKKTDSLLESFLDSLS